MQLVVAVVVHMNLVMVVLSLAVEVLQTQWVPVYQHHK